MHRITISVINSYKFYENKYKSYDYAYNLPIQFINLT